MCVYKILKVTSAFLHIVLWQLNNKNVHPVKIITDTYTAAQ